MYTLDITTQAKKDIAYVKKNGGKAASSLSFIWLLLIGRELLSVGSPKPPDSHWF